MKKGIVSILEMIIVILSLLIAFNIFFPGFVYKSKWNDALLLLRERDIILIMDRTGQLYNYSVDPNASQEFLNTIIPSNLVPWISTSNVIKSKFVIACNCTGEQISKLNKWMNRLKINGREIETTVCYTHLDIINPCIQGSDVLLIWDYKNLSTNKQILTEYLEKGSGIVEIMDFDQDVKVKNDIVQKEIFGLNWTSSISPILNFDRIKKPSNTEVPIYGPYKYFYHIPLPIEATDFSTTIPGCLFNPSGSANLTFNQTNYPFWICNNNFVWFDTDADGLNDTLVAVGDTTTIGGYKFSLNYIEDNSRISISFKPEYKFKDFLARSGPTTFHLMPIDGNLDKIFILANSTTAEYPAVILNQVKGSNVAWVADFSEDGYGDDEKLLLISLLLWASNKRVSSQILGNVQIGYVTSYINTVNQDMFEVYRFNLGLGFPY